MRRTLSVVTIAIAMLLTPLAAFAHAHPVKTNPAKDSTVSSPPQVEITFSEALEAKQCSLNVLDAMGMKMNTAMAQPVAGDAKSLTLAMPKLKPGLYTVQWKSVAVDLHSLTGNYTFTVK